MTLHQWNDSDGRVCYQLEVDVEGVEIVGQPRYGELVERKNGKTTRRRFIPKTRKDPQGRINPRTGKVRMVPPPIKEYRKAIQGAVQAVVGAFPVMECPVELHLVFVFPRPASKTWKTKPMPREPYAGSNDFDNCAKAVADALNGVLWRDDRQVWKASQELVIAAGDEESHTEIMVCWSLAEDEALELQRSLF